MHFNNTHVFKNCLIFFRRIRSPLFKSEGARTPMPPFTEWFANLLPCCCNRDVAAVEKFTRVMSVKVYKRASIIAEKSSDVLTFRVVHETYFYIKVGIHTSLKYFFSGLNMKGYLAIKITIFFSSLSIVSIFRPLQYVVYNLIFLCYLLQVRKAYRQLMSQLVSLLGGERSSAEQSLAEVFEFEHELAQVEYEDMLICRIFLC